MEYDFKTLIPAPIDDKNVVSDWIYDFAEDVSKGFYALHHYKGKRHFLWFSDTPTPKATTMEYVYGENSITISGEDFRHFANRMCNGYLYDMNDNEMYLAFERTDTDNSSVIKFYFKPEQV